VAGYGAELFPWKPITSTSKSTITNGADGSEPTGAAGGDDSYVYGGAPFPEPNATQTESKIMKTISQIGAAALAATLYFSGAPAPADEIITERVAPTAPVVVTPAPAPVIEEHRTTTTTTTTGPRRLSHGEKERLEKEREYREKVRDAEKDYQRDLREAARDRDDD
jgi:hypothetical protein